MAKQIILLADNLVAGSAVLAADTIDGFLAENQNTEFGTLYIIHNNNLDVRDAKNERLVFIESPRSGNFIKDHVKRTNALERLSYKISDEILLLNLTNFPVKLPKGKIKQLLLVHNPYLLSSPKDLSTPLPLKAKFKEAIKKMWFEITMKLFKDVDQYLVQSHQMETQLTQSHKICEGKTRLVLPYLRKDIQNFLAQKQNPEIKNYWLYPAAFHGHKNHLTLVKIAANLKKIGQKEVFYLTLDANSNEVANLMQQIKEQDLLDYFKFTGWVEKEKILELLWNAKGLIFPSTFETLGLPLIEAQLLHKKIIAADTPSNREITQDKAVYFDIALGCETIAKDLANSEVVDYQLKCADSAFLSLLGGEKIREV